MTTVTLWVDRRGRVEAYAAIGHAGFAQEGEDIICAGVSALTQAAVNALERTAGKPPHVVIRPGLLYVRVPKGIARLKRHDSQVIVDMMAQGVQDIARAYPAYVRVLWKEKRCKA